MSCECYRIDGPFIGADPDCPAHGVEAEREDEERYREQEVEREYREGLERRISYLERRVEQLLDQLAHLKGNV